MAILLFLSVVAYIGYGRWWGLARAMDVRLSITNRLFAVPAYRQYVRDIRRIEGAQPALEIVTGAGSDEDLRKCTILINRGTGAVRDGYYRFSLVARVSINNELLARRIELVDYVGETALQIHNGHVSNITLAVDEVKAAAVAHGRFVSMLAPASREALETKYPHARLELLDGRACSFRTARHVERLFDKFTTWSEFMTQRILHAGFLVPLRESGDIYRRGVFALTDGWQLGLPQALTMGDEQSCRICILVTTLDRFGEPVDDAQTIVALEQVVQGRPVIIREILSVDAGVFDVDAVNGLLAGHLAYEWIETLLSIVLIVLSLFALRFLLGILVQLKYLFTSAPGKPSGGSPKAGGETTSS